MATGNTTPISTVAASITQTFSQFPYLNQIFDQQVNTCLQTNAATNCINPPSLAQVDSDIAYINTIINDILANGTNNKEPEMILLYFKAAIEFLKVKKCVYDQYPCFADTQYLTCKNNMGKFIFSSNS